MKKFSKILALLFAAALLVGILAVVASADASDEPVVADVAEAGAAQPENTVSLAFYLTDESFAVGTPDEVVYVAVGGAMKFSGDVADGKLYLGEGKHQVYSAWNYYATLDGEAVAFEYGTALSEELYAAVIAAGGTLHVHPEYEYTQAVYGVVDSTGAETFYYEASTFVATLKTYARKTTMETVTLYDDVFHDAGQLNDRLFDFIKNGKLRLDLNGHKFVITNAIANTRIFGLMRGMTFNVYSSKPGGLISNQLGRIFDSKGSASYSGGANITFGAYGDIPGENLTVYCGRFLYSAPYSAKDSTTNNITFDGGEYHSVDGFISVRDHWNVTILNKATITTNASHSSSKYAMFQVATSTGRLTVDVKNSTLIAKNSGKADYLFHIPYSGIGKSTFNCSDTKIAGAHLISTGTAEHLSLEFGKNAEIWTNDLGIYNHADTNRSTYTLVQYTPASSKASVTCDYYNNAGELKNATIAYTGKVCYKSFATADLPKGIQVNIATNNGFWINFYVPTSMGVTIPSAELIDSVVIDNVEYAIYAVKGIAPNSVEDATLDVAFTHKDESLIWTARVSLYDYFKAIIDGDYSKLDKDLVMNAVNYCNAVYKATNSDADYAPYAELLAVEENAARIDTVVVEDAVYNIVDNTVITSATLMITDGNTAKFAFGNGGSGANLVATITRIDGTTKQLFAEERGEYYVIDEMSAYDMTATLIIKTTDGKLVAEYNLAAYLANTQDATVTAFYGYAKAAIAYQSAQLEQN